MFGSFLPPVVFEITANATQAMATFKKVDTQLKLLEAQSLKTGVAMSRMQKATIAATGFLKGFGLVAGAVAAVGIREFMTLEKNMISLGKAMANVGLNTAEYRKQVEQTLMAQERLAFDADETAKAMSILLKATGDMTQSNKLLTISMDLARDRTISVEEASRLMARATQGAGRVFKEYGISLDNTKPKAEAAQEAIDRLGKKLQGSAEAYLKTFAGQMNLLKINILNFAEAIGSVLVPMLNKMISAVRAVMGWLADHKTLLIAVAGVLTGVVAAALVLVTRKLVLAAAAWAVANSGIILTTTLLVALAAGLVYAWNKWELFRKAVVVGMKVIVGATLGAIEVFAMLSGVISAPLRGLANLAIALGGIFKRKDWVDAGKSVLNGIDSWHEKIKSVHTQVSKLEDGLKGLENKKIDTSKFKLPDLAMSIPEFKNGVYEAGNSVTELSDALVNAQQKIKDFNDALKTTAKELKTTWQAVVGRDTAKAIQDGLLNPIDQLIVKSQKAVDTYQAASNKYRASLVTLYSAQDRYTVALAGTDKAAKAAAESALKAAETVVSDLNDAMASGLADIQQYQDEMISAIVGAYNEIRDLEKQRTQTQADAQDQRLSLEKDYNSKVANLRKDYDRNVLTAQLDAAKRSADIIKQSVDQLRGIYKSATYRTIGDIFQGLTFQGRYLAGGTTEKILSALGLQKDKAAKLAENAATLAGLGFSQTFIEEVVAQGPDIGNQLATTIIDSTPESIRQMQEYWNALYQTSTHGVDGIAQKLNSGIILATEELTAALAQVQTDLTAQLAQYNTDLQDSLLEAFNDYSDALEAVNKKTAEQILGINDQITALNAKIAQLKTALAALSGLNAPGTTAPPLSLTPTPTPIVPVVPTPTGITPAPVDELDADKARYREFFGIKSAADTKPSSATTTNTKGLDQSMFGPGKIPTAANTSPTIIVQANTNASADDIATSVAWTIRTSSDIQYVTSSGLRGARAE